MERFAFITTLCILLFTSCVSCLTTIRKTIVMPAGTTEKYYQSVAIVTATPGPAGHAFHQGTAFAIDNNYLLTAGHVCESIQSSQGRSMAGPEVKLVEAGPDGLPWDEVMGVISAVDSKIDTCLILSPGHPFLPLTLSENIDVVETGDPITIVGAPAGKFPVQVQGSVIQVIAEDWLSGYPEMEPMLLKVDIEGGNSGSPVIWAGEVIGMAVMVPRRPNNTALAVPVDKLLEFVEKHTR